MPPANLGPLTESADTSKGAKIKEIKPKSGRHKPKIVVQFISGRATRRCAPDYNANLQKTSHAAK
jgi:hypothetical protein